MRAGVQYDAPTDSFQPQDCGGAGRELLGPVALSSDSQAWYGALVAVSETPTADNDISYLVTSDPGGILGIEFGLPVLLPVAGQQVLNLVLRSVNASSAQVDCTFQYRYRVQFPYVSDWITVDHTSFTLTDTYSPYTANFDIPALVETLAGIRARLRVTSLTGSGAEIRLTQAVFGLCGTVAGLAPPPPGGDLAVPPQAPPVPPGPSPPALVPLSAGPPVPPILLPPLPPGTEVLRPDRDLGVRLWHPRPVYLQINDPVLSSESPEGGSAPIYAPALLEVYDETTGEYVETIRPWLEVGLTGPQQVGPWGAILVRVRAARSRAPAPVPVPAPLPDPVLVKLPAPTLCPPPSVLKPVYTDVDGSWQRAPLVPEVSESADSSDGCAMTAPVVVPAGAPCRMAIGNPPVWEGGWRRLTVRLRARARAAREAVLQRKIGGFGGAVIAFTPQSGGLVGVPPGTVNYEIRWNPYGCTGQIQAYQTSATQIFGTALVQTNIDIYASLFLSTHDSDNLLVEVSLDGITYSASVVFDLKSYRTLVIYYKVSLNRDNQPTPTGNLPIGLSLQITGPDVILPVELRTYPPQAPLVITVSQGPRRIVPLQTRARVKVRPLGNDQLANALVQNTDTLTESYLDYTLNWYGFWDDHKIRDLRFDFTAEALELFDDAAYVDIDLIEVEVEPHCPGLSPPVVPPLSFSQTVELVPVADLVVVGWGPAPVWSRVLADPTVVATDASGADPRQPNSVVLQIGSSAGELPAVPVGFWRDWVRVEVDIEAILDTNGSTVANLDVSTNYGSVQTISSLSSSEQFFSLGWDQVPGLTTAQIERLRVGLVARAVQVGQGQATVRVRAVRVRAVYEDRSVGGVSPSPPPPPVVGAIVFVGSGEVYSCGSLGTCGQAPVSVVGTVRVVNPYAGTAAVVVQVVGGMTASVVSGGSPQDLAQGQTLDIEVRGQMGSNTDPYPRDPLEGWILATVSYSGQETSDRFRWFYTGL